jgi:ferredoxin
MLINKELCDGCGKCVAECHKAAISGGGDGKYVIDASKCSECDDIFDIECVRICEPGAIVRDNGDTVDFDRTWRLRTEHLIWLIAVMGSRDNVLFPVGSREWNAFRRLVSAAFLDPDVKVRLTKNFDDNCIGCASKQVLDHVYKCGRDDENCFEKLGVEPGVIMRLWDVVQLVEDKLSIPFIKKLGTIPDKVLECFLRYIDPDAKLRTNT